MANCAKGCVEEIDLNPTPFVKHHSLLPSNGLAIAAYHACVQSTPLIEPLSFTPPAMDQHIHYLILSLII